MFTVEMTETIHGTAIVDSEYNCHSSDEKHSTMDFKGMYECIECGKKYTKLS